MEDSIMEQMWRSGHISGGNDSYVEEPARILLEC